MTYSMAPQLDFAPLLPPTTTGGWASVQAGGLLMRTFKPHIWPDSFRPTTGLHQPPP